MHQYNSSNYADFKGLILFLPLPDIEIQLRIQVMKTISNCLNDSIELKGVFRLSGGFEYLNASLGISFKDLQDQSDATQFLTVWAETCIAAISDFPLNRLYFSETIGLQSLEKELTPYMQNTKLGEIICGLLISLSVETAAFLSIHATASSSTLHDRLQIQNVDFLKFSMRYVRLNLKDLKLTEYVFYTILKLLESKKNQVLLSTNGFLLELLLWIESFTAVPDLYATVDPLHPVSSPAFLDESKSMSLYTSLLKSMVKIGVSTQELRIILGKMNSESNYTVRKFLL